MHYVFPFTSPKRKRRGTQNPALALRAGRRFIQQTNLRGMRAGEQRQHKVSQVAALIIAKMTAVMAGPDEPWLPWEIAELLVEGGIFRCLQDRTKTRTPRCR